MNERIISDPTNKEQNDKNYYEEGYLLVESLLEDLYPEVNRYYKEQSFVELNPFALFVKLEKLFLKEPRKML